MKVDRKKIHSMLGGKCAYCGCELKDESGKHMHIDHVEPIERNPPKSQWKPHWGGYKQCEKPENNKILFPSCPPCNLLKNKLPIESFRNTIKDTSRQLNRITTYQRAIRFGLVKEIEWDGLFWFEKFNKENYE